MKQYQENSCPKQYNFDFDGTLTTGEYTDDPGPNPQMIENLKKIYMMGHFIIIWTARQWDQAPFVVSWLTKYSIPFHGIRMDKGGSNYYVDDKMLSFEDVGKIK